MRASSGRLVAIALAAVVASVVLASGTAAPSGKTYLVLYKSNGVPANAAAGVTKAGGTLVATYDAIGVAIATSSSSNFAAALGKDARIDTVAPSTQPVAKVGPFGTDAVTSHEPAPELPNAPAGTDSLAPLQWDMRQIKAPQANAITGGSPAVVVADLDTGLDSQHEDLVQNIDFSKSVSCESGLPNPNPAAWDDHNGHGTHTAGTIAAAANGHGITGVAPNVKLAGVKASNDDGYFFVHMVVCGFMWAGGAAIDNPATPGIDFPATVGPRADVTNNSYFMDPFLYNCRNDPAQRALWKAAKRAIDFAHKQGVTNVAAEGNQADDLSHPTFDDISPDFPPGTEEEREITNACVVVPVEVNGVIGVTSVGNTRQTDGNNDPNDYLKAYYSSYGVSTADVTAPGGDFYFGRGTEGQPFGLILSTWPSEAPCGRAVLEDPPPVVGANKYCYIQGTSMASPHAAGLAALIISRYGDADSPQNGKMRPGAVEAHMQQTADPQPCPTALPLQGAPGSSLANTPYSAITRPDGSPQECQGGEGHNSWYGAGQINALRAVTHDSGN